ncbi:GAD-like domain-containing protein [Gordonia sp. DT219]|uniref:GAD-like domain-containing protein n=1 Tax=Gordonia sp. DT219 TaxID=3416658 RepID=UPI003CEC4E04
MVPRDLDELVEGFAEALPVFWQGPVCGDEHVAEFGGVVPDVLVKLWRRVGFSGFWDGAMWLVDPLQWAAASEEMLRGVKVSFLEPGSLLVPVARSAFGEVWFWSPGHGVCLSVAPATGQFWSRHAQRSNPESAAFAWFSGMQDRAMDIYDTADRGLFMQALERLGPVGPDECYGFVPSILLGGPAEVSHIQKVKVREHLFVLDKIRRGEFTAEVGPRLTDVDPEAAGAAGGGVVPVESGGVGDLSVPADEVDARVGNMASLVRRFAEGVRELASDEDGTWQAVVCTLVRNGAVGYALSTAIYTPAGAWRVVMLIHEDVNRRLRLLGREILDREPDWSGMKVTIFAGGRFQVEYLFDELEALGWTSEIEGGVSRAELPDILRPEGF